MSVQWDVICPEKKGNTDSILWMNLETIIGFTHAKWKKTVKRPDYMVPFIQCVQNRPAQRDRKLGWW